MINYPTGKNILIMGGSGNIGIKVIDYLLDCGNYITMVNRGNKINHFKNRISHIVLDRSDKDQVVKYLSGMHFDIVFDNTAYCSNYVEYLLSTIKCNIYVQISTSAVYSPLHENMIESEFNPYEYDLVMMDYDDMRYGYCKRQAETALCKLFTDIPHAIVRIPYIESNDRISFYCKNIISGSEMKIKKSDFSKKMSFANTYNLARLLPWIAQRRCRGVFNYCSGDQVTVEQLIQYIERKVGKTANIDANQSNHPFCHNSFSLNTDRLGERGYRIEYVNEWFWDEVDSYINWGE